MDDKKRYNYMENVLQTINKNYISLPDDEVKRNNRVLEEVLNQIITKMKEKNTLFKYSYSRVFYGGSYYDGLRVGNPEEFDLDLLMTLPKYAEPELTNSNIPGFVHLQLKAMDKFEKQPEAHRFTGLANLMNDKHFLVTTKVSAWMEGIVNTALNDFPKSGNFTIINTSSGQFQAKIHKGGPAHTLKLTGTVAGKPVVMDVDLVPCFVFTKEKWPPSPYRKNPVNEKSEFFIVPKKPSSDGDVQQYWRLSFQEQERVLINSSRTLKPTIKLLKKQRDILDHKTVASYFIKTVFLWEVEQNKDLFNNNSLSYVFMFMLKKYKQFIEKGQIPYFWNKNNNLLKANPKALENIANKLRNIIDDIERHPQDPYVVAKYLVRADQFILLRSGTANNTSILNEMQQLQITPRPQLAMNSAVTPSTTENSSRCSLM